MTIISSRDFRSNQGKYLGMAANGENVILTSRVGSFKIVPVSGEDTIMNKSEFASKLEAAIQSIQDGKGRVVSGEDELTSFLNQL